MDLRDEAVGNTVTEWDEGQDNEGWNDVADIAPIYSYDLSTHHASNLGGLVEILHLGRYL